MARKARLTAKEANPDIQPEFKGTTLVNVLRVPRIEGGKWAISNKESLLFDTLCFPVSVAVSVVSKSKDDPGKWQFSINGSTPCGIAEARNAAIGFGSLKDTTTGKEYMLKTASGDDALPAEVKKIIIQLCKRRTGIQRLKLSDKLITSVAEIAGLAACYTAEEKEKILSRLQHTMQRLTDTLYSKKEDKIDAFVDFA